VQRLSVLIDSKLQAAIEQFIREQVQDEDKPVFEELLGWLKKVIG
jgi:hypothetical protein